MHHVAIMTKSWRLIPKILSGQKTIESRWYRTRRTPWDKISVGDTVYFKNSGEPVIAKAEVSKVLQFEIATVADAQKIADTYGKKICLVQSDVRQWGTVPKYCILIELAHPAEVRPFHIDKIGFGAGAAWLTLPNISTIRQ